MRELPHQLFAALLMLVICELSSNSVRAGDRDGNGGDVVVCNEESGVSPRIQLLDLFETKKHGFVPDLEALRSSPGFPVQNALDTIKPLTELKQELFGDIVRDIGLFCSKNFDYERFFSRELTHLLDYQQFAIEDSGKVDLPQGCHLEQLVVQTYNRDARHPEYQVNKHYWEQCEAGGRGTLEDAYRSATIIHEVVYRRLFDQGQPNSVNARYLVGLLTDKNRVHLKKSEFERHLLERGFYDYYASFKIGAKISEYRFSKQRLTIAEAHKACARFGTGFHLATRKDVKTLYLRNPNTNLSYFDSSVIPHAARYEGEGYFYWINAKTENGNQEIAKLSNKFGTESVTDDRTLPYLCVR